MVIKNSCAKDWEAIHLWKEKFFENVFYNFSVKRYPKKTITYSSKKLENLHDLESGFWQPRYERFKMKPFKFFEEVKNEKIKTVLSSNGIIPPSLLTHISPRKQFKRDNHHILDFQFWLTEASATTNAHYV